MYPVLSAEESLVACGQDIYDPYRNSSFLNNDIDLIRKLQRPKLSALLPNPSYLSPFYPNIPYNSCVFQNASTQVRSHFLKKKISQQFSERNNQGTSYSQVLDKKTSTFPPHKALCYSDSHSSRNNLLQRITEVDCKIAYIERRLVERKKIEASKNKHFNKQLKQISHPAKFDLIKTILADNKQKSHEAHSAMHNLGPQLDYPLYNQPCDTSVYHKNKKDFISFKEKLKILLRKKCIIRMKTQKALLRLYAELNCKWMSKTNKIENSRRNRSKQAKNRKYFETVFPELGKKELTREGPKRSGDHVISEAGYQEILHRLQFECLQYTLLKSSVAHPPLLLDSERGVKFFYSKNNLVTHIKGTGEKEFLNLWTPTEKAIFKEKFIQSPKDFGRIASFIDKKSVFDCIKYYYLTKKRENYKVLSSYKSKQMKSRSFFDPKKFCASNEKNLLSLPISNNSKEA